MATRLNVAQHGRHSPNIILLSEFRARDIDIDVDRGDIGDDGYEPLAEMMHEVAQELATDSVLAAWHETDDQPRIMFVSGAGEPGSSAERDLIAAAKVAAAKSTPVCHTPPADETGGSTMVTARIPASDGVATVTITVRPRVAGAYGDPCDVGTRLAAMVKPFFRLWSLRSRAMARIQGLTSAINSSDVGTLLVNGHGELVFVNAAAELMLARNDGIRRAGSILSATRLADTMRLQAAIEHVFSGSAPRDGSMAEAPVVALQRKTGRPLLAVIVPSESHGAGHDDVAAVVRVFDPDRDLDTLLAPVCRLYALSPVEARLACLLAGSVSLTDAAVQMRVQEQTARSYLKQIFLKTDTNRQAELVALLLKSAVRAAPHCRTTLI
ncbi:helix-turn-helix transcriptional regulator [Sphingomonas mollis]|uniref:HTH luxR-type domain-containing protein n=1 Tax=Sphingomonas mollis TaxID=2795726 RepID=A0ABS0XSU9_9SPHN|nr:PAS domain-containing protein [Sphingomonas sp. BT553]MBJ6122795.1 hypothetical protein [Sphingomonas sp. BT553]